MMRALALIMVAASACSACGGGANRTRTYPEPPAADVVAHIKEVRTRAQNLRAETTADIWLENDRLKVKVNIMGAWGGKLRFQAQQPNESMAADLASNGDEYCFLNARDNCGECGPATPENVGRLIGLVLEPDQIVTVLLGSTPVIEGTPTVRWDAGSGREIVELADDRGFKQKIQLDGRDRRWDVLESEVWGPDGKRIFKIVHEGFRVVGKARLPGKSRLIQGKQDGIIDWKSQELDVEIPDQAWRLEIPAGLRACR